MSRRARSRRSSGTRRTTTSASPPARTIPGPATRSLYGPLVNVTYPLPGRYTVTLTVRDAAGNNGTQAQSVDVAPAPAGDLTLPTILLSALALAAGAWYGGGDPGGGGAPPPPP